MAHTNGRFVLRATALAVTCSLVVAFCTPALLRPARAQAAVPLSTPMVPGGVAIYLEPGHKFEMSLVYDPKTDTYRGKAGDRTMRATLGPSSEDGCILEVQYAAETGAADATQEGAESWALFGMYHIDRFHGWIGDGSDILRGSGLGLGSPFTAVFWPAGSEPPPVAEKARAPLIFVPGVAGSELEIEGRVADPDVWPLAPAGSRVALALQADGRTPVIGGTRILANDVIRSVDWFNWSTVYAPLLAALEAQGYEEGKDLFVFPYDWRLDNTGHVLALAKKVDEVLEKMGGLIARAYVNSAGSNSVGTLVTIATPFYGSPKCCYALVDGYNFGNPSVRPELMKTLGQNWPSAYQLFPRKPFITEAKTKQAVGLAQSKTLHYKGFQDVDEDWFSGDDYTPTSDNVMGLNPGLVQMADEFHATLADRSTGVPKRVPSGVRHYAIAGHGVSTLNGYRMRDPLKNESFVELGDRSVVLEPVMDDGDGTVPLWSLVYPAVTGQYYIDYVSSHDSSEHTAITANPGVHALLGMLLGGYAPPPAYYALPYKAPDGFTPDLVTLEEEVDFTLHSDAVMTVEEKRSELTQLGPDENGGVREEIPSGSYLAIGGVEYASLSGARSFYDVRVRGVRDGSFSLGVRVVTGDTATTFEFPDVEVSEGTEAVLTYGEINLDGWLYPLEVTSGGTTRKIEARKVGTATVRRPSPVEAVGPPRPPSADDGENEEPGDSPLALLLERLGLVTDGQPTVAAAIAVLGACACLTFLVLAAAVVLVVVRRRAKARSGTVAG